MIMPTTKDIVTAALQRERFQTLYAGLKQQRPTGGAWISCACPFHQDKENSARFNTEDGAFECFAGCRPAGGKAQFSPFDFWSQKTGQGFADAMHDLARRLGVDRGEQCTRPAAVTIQALAADKGVTLDFLRLLGLRDTTKGVEIPYHLPDGSRAPRTRLRTALKAKDGSRWLGGGDLVPYGLERLTDARAKGALLLVEGESDCWALWANAIPALGLPGASTARLLTAEHLDGIGKIYVHQEPDRAGAQFVEGIVNRLHELGYQGKAFGLTLPGHKDPCDAAKALAGGFTSFLRDCCRGARELEIEPISAPAVPAGAAFSAPAADPVRAVLEEIKAEASGERKGIPLPFAPRLFGLAKPTRPGTLTVLAGPQGSTKSFLALSVCLAAEAAGASWQYLPCEGAHNDYLRRAVAILDRRWDALLTPDDKHDAPELAAAALDRHAATIRKIGSRICAPPKLDDQDATDWRRVADWAGEAMQATRLVVIDSLSFVNFIGRDPWRDQGAFVAALLSHAQRTGSTALLVAHVGKRKPGDRRAPLSPDDVQGSQTVVKAADCILMLQAHDRREESVFRAHGMRETVLTNRTLYLAKTRHGKGDSDGSRLALDFGQAGPTFSELGSIARDE